MSDESVAFRKAALAALEEIKGYAKEARDIVAEMKAAAKAKEADDDDD